jgi:hypothetical protein
MQKKSANFNDSNRSLVASGKDVKEVNIYSYLSTNQRAGSKDLIRNPHGAQQNGSYHLKEWSGEGKLVGSQTI